MIVLSVVKLYFSPFLVVVIPYFTLYIPVFHYTDFFFIHFFVVTLHTYTYTAADERNYGTLGFIFNYGASIPYHFISCFMRSARLIF
jgi:hypothetical protein